MFYSKIKIPVFGCALASCIATTIYADDFSDRSRTVYMLTDYGLGTYKSELMESNDTNGIVTYGIGTHTGEEYPLGVEYRVENATTTFALTTSTLQFKWDTTIIKYRLWAFELGATIGSVSAKGSRVGTEIFECVGSGYGGYFGTIIPVGRRSSINLKAMQVATGETIDKKQREVAIGPRMDIELSSRIAITRKNLDAAIGYRRRTNSITEGGTAYNELQTATFIGFATGFDF